MNIESFIGYVTPAYKIFINPSKWSNLSGLILIHMHTSQKKVLVYQTVKPEEQKMIKQYIKQLIFQLVLSS
jgi:hypothetical protein